MFKSKDLKIKKEIKARVFKPRVPGLEPWVLNSWCLNFLNMGIVIQPILRVVVSLK